MRASDNEREDALQRLSSCHAEGLLGSDTFEQRVDAVLRAVHRGQLKALLADLPSLRTAIMDVLGPLPALRPTNAYEVRFRLPDLADAPIVLGRSSKCDVVIPDATVSGRHAELRPLLDHNRWLLVDLGSLNGTYFLGRRVGRTVVKAEEQVLVGRTLLHLVGP